MTKTKHKVATDEEIISKTLDHLWQAFAYIANIDKDKGSTDLSPKSWGLVVNMSQRILNEIDALNWIQHKEGFEVDR